MVLFKLCYNFCLFVFFQVFIQGCDIQKGHYGTEFVLGIAPNYHSVAKIILDVASEKEGNLYYNIPYFNINRNITLRQGNTSIDINSTLAQNGTWTEQHGILIFTDVPVAVIMTSYSSDTAESYLALPIPALGSHYRVASYRPLKTTSRYDAVILVIAAFDNTSVTVRGFYNTTTSLILNRLFVHQISSSDDLSNTEIIASKPVAVISGTLCANVPHNVKYCDMLLEQMIPVESWQAGTYIVPPFFMSKGFILKILTNSSDTFCLQNSTRKFCNTSQHLPEEDFLMGTDPVVVTSSEHISVVQYGLGKNYDSVDGDPYMTLIPSIDNYLNAYYFVIPEAYSNLTSFISVIVPLSKVHGLWLDGSAPTARHQYSVPGMNFTVLLFEVGIGYHTLKHSDAGVKFGALVYGRKSGVGYGFPVGFQFSKNKQASSPSSTSSTPSVTTKKLSTTSYSGRGTTCFSCDDMSHVELCDTIKHCSDAEICYMESYIKSGRKTFRSGCISSAVCHQELEIAKTMTDRCVECCSDDYCNNQGCGETGLPPLDQRGPLCFDCHHVWSSDECNTVSLCEKGQICSIEEYHWGDHSHFKMGCSNGLCNPISRSVHMSLRSLPSCHTCCNDDYCNTNCTRGATGNEGSILVG